MYTMYYDIWNDPSSKGVKVDYWVLNEDGSKEFVKTFEEPNVGRIMDIIARMGRCFSNYKFVSMKLES